MSKRITPVNRDKEMERAIERAMKLRITLNEMCAASNTSRVSLYRWRYEDVSPIYASRMAFVEGVERLIAERMQEYMADE